MRPSGVRSFVLFSIICCVSFAQAPTVGIVEIYGADKTPKAEIRKVLSLQAGSKLPASKGDVEERLEQLPSVVTARLEAACCEDGQLILYVGLEEKNAPHFDYQDPPTEELYLPEEVVTAYRSFLSAVSEAGRAGDAGEDLTHGHSLFVNEAVRAVQSGFIPLANQHLAAIRKVLRDSSNEDHRAMAAYVIGYTDKKSEIVGDLQHVLRDPDDTVRSNALRSLAALAVLAQKNPASEVKVSPTWMIEMLNSVVWTDRHNACVALATLTDSRDRTVLTQLRERALPSLKEMAAWKHLPHALPAYILLGRSADIPEKELQEAWANNQRDKIIARATAKQK